MNAVATAIDASSFSRERERALATVKRLGIVLEYPFEPHFFETPMGAMHFVDEGPKDRPVLLMLHGNPSWSFLYRRFIKAFAPTHRVVAPDHIGFGLSDKPADEATYSIDGHVSNLEGLVTSLDLRDVTLMMQDWGGPIGLGMAARHPDRITRLALLNTFGFYPPAEGMDPEKLKLPAPLRLMRSRGVGDYLVRRAGFFERRAMPMAIADQHAWGTVRHAYTGVFQSAADRAGVMAFPRLIPTNTQHPSAKLMLEETGPYLDRFDGPACIFWGKKDPFFPKGVLEAWRKKLPQAGVTELPRAKHYIQEDAPDTVIGGLGTFLAG